MVGDKPDYVSPAQEAQNLLREDMRTRIASQVLSRMSELPWYNDIHQPFMRKQAEANYRQRAQCAVLMADILLEELKS